MLVLWYQEPMEDKTFGNDCAGIDDSKTLMKKVKIKAAGATSVSDMLLTDICDEWTFITESIMRTFYELFYCSSWFDI